ncbi:uncharacterized protein LOC111333259 [Stylophora pistillata]|nr:uncharacterized protein LOC111333259 [Stylophora pistillata]
MPHTSLFTQVDPVLELRRYNMAPSITRGKGTNRIKSAKNESIMTGIGKERLKSRERSTTLATVSSIAGYHVTKQWSREGSSLIGQYSSKKVNFSSKPLQLSRSNAKPGNSSSKPRGKVGDISSKNKLQADRSGRATEMIKGKLPTTEKRRASETPALLMVTSRKRSLSVPPDGKEHFSITTIVKARSLAMKWRGRQRKQGRKQTILPTITDDRSKFSLCANVKCSPQFEEVIKLLEGDQGVEDVGIDLKSLQLK